MWRSVLSEVVSVSPWEAQALHRADCSTAWGSGGAQLDPSPALLPQHMENFSSIALHHSQENSLLLGKGGTNVLLHYLGSKAE